MMKGKRHERYFWTIHDIRKEVHERKLEPGFPDRRKRILKNYAWR